MPHPAVETELKFTAAGPAVLAALRGELVALGAEVQAATARTVRDCYLDTDDWWLYRAGAACRLRLAEEGALLTVKALGRVEGGLAARGEVEEALACAPAELSGAVPGEKVGAWLRPLMKGRPVGVKLALEKRGETFEAATAAGLAVKVSAEVVSVKGAGASFVEVELELMRGGAGELRRLGEELRRRLGLEAATASKFQRGLQALGIEPPRLVEGDDLRLGKGDRFVDAGHRVLRRHLGRMRWHEPGARLGMDAERLHNMRVATRRLRAALGVFGEALPSRRVAWMRRELSWIAAALGAVRDLDVYLAGLEEDAEAVSAEVRPALDRYREELLRRRDKARAAMLRMLDSKRFARFVERVGRWLASGPPARPRAQAARGRVGAAAAAVVRRRLRKVLRRGRAVGPEAPGGDLHALRIGCKRLRYVCEFLADLLGPRAARLVERLIELQDVLGAHQDALVAQQMAERYALAPGRGRRADRRLGLALGQLSAHHAARARETRAAFFKVWKKFDRRKTRAALREKLKRLAAS